MNLSEFLKEGVDVVEASLGDFLPRSNNTVYVYPIYLYSLRESKEIRAAIEKRFKGKLTRYGSPGHADLVLWCLSTDGYKLRSELFHSVSDEDVCAAWQFIDTMSVSSTEKCRGVIELGKGNRSGVGFSRAVSSLHHSLKAARRPAQSQYPSSAPVVLRGKDGGSYEHDTIESLVIEDCTSWVLKSRDPVGATVSLGAYFRSRDKSV